MYDLDPSAAASAHDAYWEARQSHPSLAPGPNAEPDTEAYAAITENAFVAVRDDPLVTFSSDADTASYANVRRFVRAGRLPPAAAVRIEELVNYFDYAYDEPTGDRTLAVRVEVAPCPWAPKHLLARVGLKVRSLRRSRVPPRNLVFLVDVSGSMSTSDRLPLVQNTLEQVGARLRREDTVAVVVYAGAAGLVLPPTNDPARVRRALRRLDAGGPTNGADGIQLAYDVATAGFREGGVNRVLLATDGDFNVGTSSIGELVRLVEREREGGVFLTVLGFGRGNLDDATLEALADHGNGNYAYIDGPREAEKVLGRELDATLVAVARDVKLQVELNPARVAAYRLLGYENRALADHQFTDDGADAGELGAGDEVTALLELVPVGSEPVEAGLDPLKYQTERRKSAATGMDELMTVKVRYLPPGASASAQIEAPVRAPKPGASTSDDFRLAAAAAEMGLLLRDSSHKAIANWSQVEELARGAIGADPHGDRRELVEIVRAASKIAARGG